MSAHRYAFEDVSWTWVTESTDSEFADKLDKEFMMEDYKEEAERRGVSLKELFALILQEALEPID